MAVGMLLAGEAITRDSYTQLSEAMFGTFPGEIVVVYTPGGGHKFYQELGPLTRNGTPDRAAVAAVFEKHDMTLLGPPISDG